MPTLAKPEPVGHSISTNRRNLESKYRRARTAHPSGPRTTLSCFSESLSPFGCRRHCDLGNRVWVRLIHEEAGLPLSAARTLGIDGAVIAFIASFIHFRRTTDNPAQRSRYAH